GERSERLRGAHKHGSAPPGSEPLDRGMDRIRGVNFTGCQRRVHTWAARLDIAVSRPTSRRIGPERRNPAVQPEGPNYLGCLSDFGLVSIAVGPGGSGD